MKQPLVTVIVTTYNRADMIENAIVSVLNQTYKNIEFIVVDDNKEGTMQREQTAAIVRKYPTIKYIQNEKNLGGALSRNVGIDNANGEFIAFLDDDDKFIPEKIEKQYNCYLEHKNDNVGLIYCHHYRVDYEGNIFGEYHNSNGDKPLYENMIKCIASTSLWFCPKEVLIKIGMFEDAPCKQDSIVLLKMLANGYNVFKVPENLVFYYEYVGNRISGTKMKNIEGLINYKKWCEKYYDRLTKKEIKNVEYNFSKDLVTLYVFNNMKNEMKKELKNMIILKPFNKKTILAIFKYIFPNQYFKILKVLKKGKK